MKKGNNTDYSSAAALFERGCLFEDKNGIGFFRARSLLRSGGVRHGFTARYGGVSAPPYDSLNLCFGKVDSHDNVRENFRRFTEAEGIDYSSMIIVNFEHGVSVVPVTCADAGRGVDPEMDELPVCDGIITDDPRVTLVTNHADCGVFFVYDPVRKAIGIAHAGWKGTLGRIGGRMVSLMRETYGSDPANMIASNGPCICRDCYEVDEELGERFVAEFGCGALIKPGKPGKSYLDMEAAQAIQLMDEGVLPQNITLMEKCTFESPETLFSYRRERKPTGDMAGFISLT